MSSKTKTFTISDHDSLDKVDSWWAGLLRNGPKEIVDLEWTSSGDLVWLLKLTWKKLDFETSPFNVCMPAYSHLSLEDLHEINEVTTDELGNIKNNLSVFKKKLDDWEVIEVDPSEEQMPSEDELTYGIDPNLSYASKLDVVEKIMVSEFLWPYYKSMVRSYLMLEARIEELGKEIEHRNDSTYTVVRMDRGMLRSSFIEQVGYDNKWLFASDDEIFEDYYEGDEDPEA